MQQGGLPHRPRPHVLDQGCRGTDPRARAGHGRRDGAALYSGAAAGGIEAAKAKGIYKGRKPSVPVEKVREMHTFGHGPSVIAKALGISRMSVHRVLTEASDMTGG